MGARGGKEGAGGGGRRLGALGLPRPTPSRTRALAGGQRGPLGWTAACRIAPSQTVSRVWETGSFYSPALLAAGPCGTAGVWWELQELPSQAWHHLPTAMARVLGGQGDMVC